MTTMNRSLISTSFFITAVAVIALPLGVLAFSGSGAGTSGDPYQITTCLQLQEMNDELDAQYVFANNIDCADTATWNDGAGFAPIGSSSAPFIGSLNGQDFEVSDLFINASTTSGVGLFGIMESAEIENVGVVGADVTGQITTGILVGQSNGTSSISNSYSSGRVVSAGSDDGVTSQQAGGLVGNFESGTITNSYSSAEVGDEDSEVVFGGLVGVLNAGSVMSNSFATGNVRGRVRVGGLVGDNFARIENSYATGDVFVNNVTIPDGFEAFDGSVGGFAGLNIGLSPGATEIDNSFSTGSVTGAADVGGFVGMSSLTGLSDGVTTNSFWDTETSGVATSSGGTAATTAELQDIQTFTDVGWDIAEASSDLNDGYPYLAWQDDSSSAVWLIAAETVGEVSPSSGGSGPSLSSHDSSSKRPSDDQGDEEEEEDDEQLQREELNRQINQLRHQLLSLLLLRVEQLLELLQ